MPAGPLHASDAEVLYVRHFPVLLDTAMQKFEMNRDAHELGQPIELARAEYDRGRLLLRKGLYAQAVEHLRAVRHRFLIHSLAEEAGLCGLEMVEGLLMLARADEAERLARTIMSEFLAASLNSRAITALGYLTEAIEARNATPRTAMRVREYVLSLRTSPEREFETHE
ncbi:MAG TPA: hypothetical protein VGF69_22525 [Thermoanaerobaculia bacterium]|jgi:hypothetical protein